MERRMAVWIPGLLLAALLAFAGCSAAQQGPSEDAAAVQTNKAASGQPETEESVELIIFAAASLQETLTEVTEEYMKAHPDTGFACNFDSSGTLQTQIEEGASCDIFVSAAQKQMDELENPADGASYIDDATRTDLLENKVTLVVPEGNPQDITSFQDLAQKLKAGNVLLAVGNSDVPVGQYTRKIFAYYGLKEEDLAAAGELTYGSNVKEVTTQVSEGSVDAGIIYATDAFSADLTVVGQATPEMCGQVIYPAAVLAQCTHKDAAEAFLEYLTDGPAMQIFESVGFSPAAS